MLDQNELMTLVVAVLFGLIFIYIGVQTPEFGYAFIIGGLFAIAVAIKIGYGIFYG